MRVRGPNSDARRAGGATVCPLGQQRITVGIGKGTGGIRGLIGQTDLAARLTPQTEQRCKLHRSILLPSHNLSFLATSPMTSPMILHRRGESLHSSGRGARALQR